MHEKASCEGSLVRYICNKMRKAKLGGKRNCQKQLERSPQTIQSEVMILGWLLKVAQMEATL